MLKDRQSCIDDYERFIKRIIKNKTVWGLKTKNGWAVAPSNEYENRDVYVFWSDKAYARRAAIEEWGYLQTNTNSSE